MTLIPADRARHVVPRWRPSASYSSIVELSPARTAESSAFIDTDFESLEREFRENPGVWTAADLVSAATTRGVRTAAVLEALALLEGSASSTPALKSIIEGRASRIATRPPVPIEGEGPFGQIAEEARRRVSVTRRALQVQPHNALRWMDLGLAYLTLGNVPQASRAVRGALSIAPRNRYVLRSSARFFVHNRQPDEALHWLDRSGRTLGDPWLLAAHISVSQVSESPIRYIRAARELLVDENIAPISASELSAAIASEELKAGRTKPAKLYMISALRRPTENAVAQAIWSQDRGLRGVEASSDAAPLAFEAATLAAMQESDWAGARSEVETWLADEPFSVRAAVHASYIALTGQADYSDGLAFAEMGLRTSPSEPMLLNNAAFAEANLGNLPRARALLDHATTGNPTMAALLMATRGLVEFRAGALESGRQLYLRAAEDFRSRNEVDLAMLCNVMLAREEIRGQTDVGQRLFSELSRLRMPETSRDARVWFDRIRKELRTGQ